MAPPEGPQQGPIAHALGLGRGVGEDQIRRALGLLGPDGMPIRSSQTQAPGSPDQGWFGPGQAPQPVAPRGDAFGRAFDYPTGFNLTPQPRKSEAVSYETLRGMAQAYDLLRLAVETRKDQLSELSGSVQPRKAPHQQHRPPADERCKALTKWFRKPDGENYFDQWMRMLADDQLVIDASTLVRRDDRAGRFHAAEVIDGATISRLLDVTGRTPTYGPAYQQVLKGLPAVNYTTEEIIYAPRNKRTYKVYGLSPCEQVITTANIGLRRMTQQLYHHTDGNIPEALIGVPETWSLPQIEAFQRHWDNMQRDQVTRRRAKFVPGQFAYQPTRADGQLMDQFDEWLSRIICYAFSLPPTAFVRMMNRATAETSYDSSIREGLAPMMTWARNVINDVITKWHGYDDLEWVWDDSRNLDPTEQLTVDEREMRAGIRSMDDLRAERGLSPYGLPSIVFGIGPLGFLTIDQMKQMIADGSNLPPPPMMPGMVGPDGMPLGNDQGMPSQIMSPEGMPPGGDPLAGASPELLAQLGIDPEQAAAEDDEAAAAEEEQMAMAGGPPARGGLQPRGGAPVAPGPMQGADPRKVVRSLLRHVDRRMSGR